MRHAGAPILIVSAIPHALQEYGSGRARLPGLEEMMAAMQAEGRGAAPGSGAGLAAPPSRPSGGSSVAAPPPSSSGGGAGRATKPASGGGGGASGASDAPPSLGDYLKFGRLLGEKPQQVQQQLALGGTKVMVDEQSADYLQVRGMDGCHTARPLSGAVTGSAGEAALALRPRMPAPAARPSAPAAAWR